MVATFVLTSCIEEWKDPLSGKGTRELRYSVNEFSVVTFKPFSTETKDLLTIYRDEISSSSTDKEVAFTFEINSDSLDAYNEEHETEFEVLPEEAYTLNVEPGTVTFGPDESAKTITITLNTSLMDLATKYALPFVMKDASGGSSTKSNLAIVQTLPINKYDGVYEATEGEMIDAANATLGHINIFRHSAAAADVGIEVGSNQEWALVTSGEVSCDVMDYNFFGGFNSTITSGASYSQYGSFSPVFHFDPETDRIVAVTNRAGQPAGNTRYATVDPEAANQWSEEGIEDVGYRMHHPTVMGGAYNAATPDAACEGCYGSEPRSVWSETWAYVGPRP